MENSTPIGCYDYYAFDRRMKAKWDSMTEEEIKKESDDFNKYHAEMIVSSIQSLLCHGTERIEEWMDIDEGDA